MITGTLLLTIIAAGCASPAPPVADVLPTVSIKSNPTVRIATIGNAPILPLLQQNAAAVITSKGGKVVDSAPDYWIVIYGTQDQRVDSAEDQQFNVVYAKESRSYHNGSRGEDVITAKAFNTAVNAHFISVIIYEAKTLSPVINFSFPFYSGGYADNTRSRTAKSDLQIAASFNAKMKQILNVQ